MNGLSEMDRFWEKLEKMAKSRVGLRITNASPVAWLSPSGGRIPEAQPYHRAESGSPSLPNLRANS